MKRRGSILSVGYMGRLNKTKQKIKIKIKNKIIGVDWQGRKQY
jgi:hypothetical protein